jgi:hypothetical protein
MGPSRSVLMNAIVIAACLGVLAGVSPSAAQRHEAELRSLDYSPDPLARSPRLLGMGRLTLADDLHNRLSLWDFAGNPTGIAEAESVSTLEYRPLLRTRAVLHDVPAGTGFRDRQELRARQMRHGLEAWRRAPGTTAYGMVAELATLQVDRPFGEGIERRGRFTVPAIGGAVNGRVPWLKSDRFDYALRIEYGLEVHDDLYYEFLQLPQGDYLGHQSPVASPPDLFTPDRIETTSLRGGVAFSMRVTRSIKAAVGYDRARVRVRSTLEGLRSTSKVDADRPFDIGQASLMGRLGRHFEWIADGRAWRSQSEEFFFWSVSAGPSQPPLVGNGKRLDRDERGTSLRTRVRWTSGPFELGAGLGTQFRRAIDTPWYRLNTGDPTGFNDFLAEVGARPGADTLLLPPRIEPTRVEERALEISGGGTVQLPGGRGVLGAEVHRRRLAQTVSIGGGPTPKGWEVRAGGEYRCSETFLARAGWSYGVRDRDDLTSDDAYRSAMATAGFGHRPAGSRWSVDLGYAYEWVRPDFVDPVRNRGNDQHLAVQMRWQF